MSKFYQKFPENLTGMKSGKLTVIRRVHKKLFKESVAWLCKCSCGRYHIKSRAKLTSGRYKSCGCSKSPLIKGTVKSAHGFSHTVEYSAWKNMIKRCYAKSGKSYYRYGGRGISVCERWIHSFGNFLSDIGKKPSPKHTLERMDNDGNYEPGNICWATRETQSNNTRRNVKALYKGEMLSIAQIARASGCKEGRIRWWLRKGFSPNDAVSKAIASCQ